MSVVATFLLVFIGLPESGEFQTAIIESYDSLEECYIAMDNFVEHSGVPDEPWNWDLVCLEDVRNSV